MHKINDFAYTLIDKLEQMYIEDDFDGELQDLFEEYEDKITKHCKELYPNGDVCIWDYDPEYDNCNLEEKLQDILEYLNGKTLLDSNMSTLEDVLMITVVTKKGVNNA